MKRMLGAIALAVTITPAFAADVGVSVTIGQPGFYGTIEIGDYPRPRLIYAEPKIIRRAPMQVVEPIYMRVPPGHARNWRKHCGKYDACGRPVYFVQDSWYNNVYVPHYHERSRGDGRGRDDDQGRNYNDDDRGNGNKGKGNKGKGRD